MTDKNTFQINDQIRENRDEEVIGESRSLLRQQSSTTFSGFELRIEDLVIWVPGKKKKTEPKVILKGITTEIKRGQMTAIIGPSGSGKTTMMNYLSGRQDYSQNFKTFCHYYINKTEINDISDFKNIIGYVLQEDIMDTRMTPRELFHFYLKMRKNIEKEKVDQKEVVNDMIDLLALSKCADTKVGDVFTRGLSGGEKKRTSIGIELISNPNLLFLDEPTTGLDSTTALNVMETVRDLKQRGITIISTIHSPSEKILRLFDKIIILCEGNLVFDGPPDKIEGYLSSLDFKSTKYVPSLEYFMQVIDKDDLRIQFSKTKLNDEEFDDNFEKKIDEEYRKRIDLMTEHQREKTLEEYERNWKMEQSLTGANFAKITKISKTKNLQKNVFIQFGYLFWKFFSLFVKDYKNLLMKFLLFFVTTIFLFLVYIDLGSIKENPLVAIQNRGGFMFLILANSFFGGLNLSSTSFIPQKQIFLKDYQGRVYNRSAFFLASFIYIIPFYICMQIGACAIYFYATDLNNDEFVQFLWFNGFVVFGSFLGGIALGTLVGVIVPKIENIGAAIPIIALPMFLVAGFLAAVKTMAWPLRIFSFISPLRYAFQGLILNEFTNAQTYIDNCPPSQPPNSCNPFSFYDFYEKERWLNILILLCLIAFFLLLSYIVFIIKFGEKKTQYGFEKSIIDKYAKINPSPRKF
jgi:ABC-type multidrug transport system ATPase subunit/ABC-type multidrug transport system permease subunit